MSRRGRSQKRGPSRRLRQALREALPNDKVLEGLSYSENRRSFSIRLDIGWTVHAAGVRLVPPMKNGREQPQCDALFVIRDPGKTKSLIVLVELKGGDGGYAIKQLKASRDRLCKNGPDIIHDVAARKAKAVVDTGHGGVVLGVCVTNRGLPQNYLERKRSRPELWIKKCGIKTVLSPSELYKLAEC